MPYILFLYGVDEVKANPTVHFLTVPMPIPETPTLRSSIDQFSLFLKESRAIGCPSFLWFFPYLSVQVKTFSVVFFFSALGVSNNTRY